MLFRSTGIDVVHVCNLSNVLVVPQLFPMLGLRSGGSTLGMFGVQGDQGKICLSSFTQSCFH